MRLIAKTRIKTLENVYQSGDTIDEILSPKEINRLQRLGAIDVSGDRDIDAYDAPRILSDNEIRKMSTKQKLVEYGASIGLDLNVEDHKEDLIMHIINYQDELNDR